MRFQVLASDAFGSSSICYFEAESIDDVYAFYVTKEEYQHYAEHLQERQGKTLVGVRQ